MAETTICEHCHLAHPAPTPADNGDPLMDDLYQLRACCTVQATAMRLLISHVGKKATCDGPTCGRTIYWVTHTNGKRTPYTEAGLCHFIDCPDRDRFRRKP